jgi:CoA:oxalate CoA-transferase
LPEVCATDWGRQRGVVVEVSDRSGGTIRVPNSPWRFASAPTDVAGETRFRGEDNRQVLAELLDLTDDDIDRLQAEGVISSRERRR